MTNEERLREIRELHAKGMAPYDAHQFLLDLVTTLTAERDQLRGKAETFDAFVDAIKALEPHLDGPKPEVEALLDKVKQLATLRAERDQLRADEQLLVGLFRSPDFDGYGRDGDHDNLRPCETAVRTLKRLKHERDQAREECAAFRDEISVWMQKHDCVCHDAREQFERAEKAEASAAKKTERIEELVKLCEVAKWLTHQYRLAMAKGIQIGQGRASKATPAPLPDPDRGKVVRDAQRKDYIEITIVTGPNLRGCNIYTVPWGDLNDVLDNYLDDIEVDEERTLSFKLRQLTDEEFEDICES